MTLNEPYLIVEVVVFVLKNGREFLPVSDVSQPHGGTSQMGVKQAVDDIDAFHRQALFGAIWDA